MITDPKVILADLETLKADVAKLVAAIVPASSVDLQPIADAVAELDAEVVKATPAPPAPAP